MLKRLAIESTVMIRMGSCAFYGTFNKFYFTVKSRPRLSSRPSSVLLLVGAASDGPGLRGGGICVYMCMYICI